MFKLRKKTPPRSFAFTGLLIVGFFFSFLFIHPPIIFAIVDTSVATGVFKENSGSTVVQTDSRGPLCPFDTGPAEAVASIYVGNAPSRTGDFDFDFNWPQVNLSCPEGLEALAAAESSMTNALGQTAAAPAARMKLVSAAVAHLCMDGTIYERRSRNYFKVLDQGALPPQATDCSGFVSWIYQNLFWQVSECGYLSKENTWCPLCFGTNTHGIVRSFTNAGLGYPTKEVSTKLISRQELLPGDIITSKPGNAELGHALLYVGKRNGKDTVIHCTGNGCSLYVDYYYKTPEYPSETDNISEGVSFYRFTYPVCLRGLGLTEI